MYIDMHIISEIRKKYKSIPSRFDIENVYYLETQQEYYEKGDKDYQLIDIDKPIPLEVLNKIHYLEVSYSEGRSFEVLQRELGRMTSLHTLSLPAIYMEKVQLLPFPKSLRSLRFINESTFNDFFKRNKKIFQKEKLLKDLKLENLLFLRILHLSNSKSIEEYIQLSPEQFPNLEYVEFGNDDEGSFLAQLQAFPNIKHLAFGPVKVPIFESLAPFSNTLESLDLGIAQDSFTFKGIGILKKLQTIWINSTYCDTDCSAFLEVPQIKEITLMYGKNVTNAEAILELPNLIYLQLSDCKTPDKKKLMTKELKKKFVERGFKSVW